MMHTLVYRSSRPPGLIPSANTLNAGTFAAGTKYQILGAPKMLTLTDMSIRSSMWSCTGVGYERHTRVGKRVHDPSPMCSFPGSSRANSPSPHVQISLIPTFLTHSPNGLYLCVCEAAGADDAHEEDTQRKRQPLGWRARQGTPSPATPGLHLRTSGGQLSFNKYWVEAFSSSPLISM